MPFLHDQISGGLWHKVEDANPWRLIARGYAGNGDGLNNPLWQGVKNHGPLPVGKYTLKPEYIKQLGGNVYRLLPDPSNVMFGRSNFLLHWGITNRDKDPYNLLASDGCICHIEPATFIFVAQHVSMGDDSLTVVSMPPLVNPPGSPPVGLPTT